MNTLPLKWQKTVRFIHILFAFGWVAGILASLYIFLQLRASADPILQDQLNLLVYNLAYKLVTPAFLGSMITALIFALYTKYGFFRFYWLIGKWVLLVLAYCVFSFTYLPQLHFLTAISELNSFSPGTMVVMYETALNKAFFLNFLNLGILLLVLFLSGFKPWGIRKGAREFKINKKLRIFAIATLAIILIFGIMSEFQMNKIRTFPVHSPDLSKMASDTYFGEYDYHFVYKVKVILEDGILTEIEVTHNRESVYAKLAEGVINKILHEQRVDVDAVTGATTTSVAIQKAVENALMD